VLILIGAALIAVARRLVMVRPCLILIARRLCLIVRRLIVLASGALEQRVHHHLVRQLGAADPQTGAAVSSPHAGHATILVISAAPCSEHTPGQTRQL
jgi:hypothetical protein